MKQILRDPGNDWCSSLDQEDGEENILIRHGLINDLAKVCNDTSNSF